MSLTRADDLVVHYDLRNPEDAPVVVVTNSLGSTLDVREPPAR
jgi:hypothetical protein